MFQFKILFISYNESHSIEENVIYSRVGDHRALYEIFEN